MDTQTLINVAAGIVIAIAGWLARVLWDAVEKLKADIHELEVHLPTNYIRRDEFNEGLREIKDSLNKILDKLENKADKP
jgi:hypothetical protein